MAENIATTTEIARKLPVFMSVVRSWLFIMENQGKLWRLIWFPLLAFPAIAIAHFHWLERAATPHVAVASFVVCGALILIPALTTWHRLVVLGEFPKRFIDRLKFGKREIVFLLVSGGLNLIVDKLIGFAEMLIDGHFTNHAQTSVYFIRTLSDLQSLFLGLAISLLPFMLLPVFLLLPRIAVGHSILRKEIWNISNNSYFRFIFSAVLFSITFAAFATTLAQIVGSNLSYIIFLLPFRYTNFITYYIPDETFLILLPGGAVIGGVFIATFLSICYRHLQVRDDIAAVFE